MASVASVYAKALFELTQEKGQQEVVLQELRLFSEQCKAYPILDAVLGSGYGVDSKKRQAIVQDLASALKLGALTTRFLNLIVVKGRSACISEIVSDFEGQLEKSKGILSGTVSSAVELSAAELAKLSEVLAKRMGKAVKLTPTVDASLLGGVLANVGGKTFDATLRAQLNKFKNELN